MNKLSEKLQLKSGTNWLLFNVPGNYLPLIEPLPDNVNISFEVRGVFDGIHLFVKNKTELISSLKIILPLLKPETICWISYPKKNSVIDSDLDKTTIWDELHAIGLKIVTSISIDKTWAAFRFKPIELVKLSDSRNSNIRQNKYSEYIDVDNKQITLPADIIMELLQQNPNAMTFYQGLSYSNKKEYVVWILSAKQEKTRIERLGKMVEKLLAAKKNPTEK
jgi:hypothetical protein